MRTGGRQAGRPLEIAVSVSGYRSAAVFTSGDVDVEHALQVLRPRHRCFLHGTFRMFVA